MADLPPNVPVLATTATANARVVADVAEQLGTHSATGDNDNDTLVLRGTLDRESLSLHVVRLDSPEERFAFLAEHLPELPGSGVIYTLAALETRVDLRRSRLETMLKVLDVDGAVRRVKGGWVSTGQSWHYDAERYARVAEAREAEQRTMIEYETTAECRMTFLRRQLDGPAIEGPCGRCDNCAGAKFTASVTGEGAEAARAALAKPGVQIAARKLWPTGMSALGVALTGKIGPAESAETGRALGRLTDLGWGMRLRDLLADNTPTRCCRSRWWRAS